MRVAKWRSLLGLKARDMDRHLARGWVWLFHLQAIGLVIIEISWCVGLKISVLKSSSFEFIHHGTKRLGGLQPAIAPGSQTGVDLDLTHYHLQAFSAGAIMKLSGNDYLPELWRDRFRQWLKRDGCPKLCCRRLAGRQAALMGSSQLSHRIIWKN